MASSYNTFEMTIKFTMTYICHLQQITNGLHHYCDIYLPFVVNYERTTSISKQLQKFNGINCSKIKSLGDAYMLHQCLIIFIGPLRTNFSEILVKQP